MRHLDSFRSFEHLWRTPAAANRISSWRLEVKVAGSNPPTAGQLTLLAALCCSQLPSGKLMYTFALLIKEAWDKGDLSWLRVDTTIENFSCRDTWVSTSNLKVEIDSDITGKPIRVLIRCFSLHPHVKNRHFASLSTWPTPVWKQTLAWIIAFPGSLHRCPSKSPG